MKTTRVTSVTQAKKMKRPGAIPIKIPSVFSGFMPDPGEVIGG
jgi:hypothetical protein